jgi:hypothetical protein
VAVVGYIFSGGILPNAHKGLSLITYPIERSLLPGTSDSESISLIQLPSLDLGTLKGKVLGPTGLPAVGATVIAEKELGVITSAMKEGSYTTNSFVTVDGYTVSKYPQVFTK